MKITLQIDKSVEQNAEEYYQRAATAKKKIGGAKRMVEKAKQELDSTEEKEVSFTIHLDKRRKKWYESYHWCHTKNNYLCIGGRDASSNEAVIKKHLEKGDLVYHTDAPGSPFVVLKNGQEAEDVDRKNAAMLAGLYSKAWKSGLGEIEVMEVFPDQVTKETQSGEYISTGSFMIYGDRNMIRVPLDLGIGIRRIEDDILLMAGPLDCVKQHCKAWIELEQGAQSKGDISNHTMKILNIARNDSILTRLPSGTFRIEDRYTEELKDI